MDVKFWTGVVENKNDPEKRGRHGIAQGKSSVGTPIPISSFFKIPAFG